MLYRLQNLFFALHTTEVLWRLNPVSQPFISNSKRAGTQPVTQLNLISVTKSEIWKFLTKLDFLKLLPFATNTTKSWLKPVFTPCYKKYVELATIATLCQACFWLPPQCFQKRTWKQNMAYIHNKHISLIGCTTLLFLKVFSPWFMK